jgi:AcrR family transcriptional regulator
VDICSSWLRLIGLKLQQMAGQPLAISVQARRGIQRRLPLTPRSRIVPAPVLGSDLRAQVCAHIVARKHIRQEKSTQISVMTVRSDNYLATKEKILKVADRLFYLRGIRAVGVDTISAEVGISKRTLYDYFPSKNDLIAAYLLRRFRPAKASKKAPADEILDEFDRLGRAFASEKFRGCAFVNAVTELSEPTHAANKIAVAFKEQRRNWFKQLLTKSGVSDSEGLSTQLMLLVDGAVTAALVHRKPSMALAARDAAAVLLAARGIFPSCNTLRKGS